MNENIVKCLHICDFGEIRKQPASRDQSVFQLLFFGPGVTEWKKC